MKLTISSNPLINKKQSIPLHFKRNIHQNQPIQQDERQKLFLSKCPGFFFDICIDTGSTHTDRNEIIESHEEKLDYLLTKTEVFRDKKIQASQNRQKSKICLSLKQKSTKNQTPHKNNNQRNQKRYYSETKKQCPSDQLYSNNIKLLTPKKKLDFERHSKLKTEPIQQIKSADQNVLTLKQSQKPSTNVLTPSRASLKQSVNSKKPKITLSNNFKSQVIQQNMNLVRSADDSLLIIKKQQTNLASNSVFIEQSLTIQKMKNIYEDRSGSFMKPPSSNKVYYNQATWKHPIILKQSSKKQIKAQQRNISILRGLEDNEQNYKPPQLTQNQVEFEQKFQQSKFIGLYAKTIKTFNESQHQQQNQSLVIEHGLDSIGQFLASRKNRESIKNYPCQSQVIKRNYSSFGQDQSFNITRNRQYVSHPI